MKNDPVRLREQAKKLLAQAEAIEREKFIRVGKAVLRFYEKDFADFDFEVFKKAIKKEVEN